MKYLAIFDDEFLWNFRKDGLTLVLKDKAGATRGVQLKPLIRPVVINEKSGESVYITDGHIKAMLNYEEKETLKKIMDQIYTDLKNAGDIKAMGRPILQENGRDIEEGEI